MSMTSDNFRTVLRLILLTALVEFILLLITGPILFFLIRRFWGLSLDLTLLSAFVMSLILNTIPAMMLTERYEAKTRKRRRSRSGRGLKPGDPRKGHRRMR